MPHKIWPKSPEYIALRNKPAGSSYRKYLDALQQSFHGRCGYCGTPIDSILIRPEIDHFMPQNEIEKSSISAEKQNELINDTFTNLIYACPPCNRAKGGDWIGGIPDNMDFVCEHCFEEQGYIHPCHPSYEDHLHRDESGRICATSAVGGYMVQQLKLWRIHYRIIWLREQIKVNLEYLCRTNRKAPHNEQVVKDILAKFLAESRGL